MVWKLWGPSATVNIKMLTKNESHCRAFVMPAWSSITHGDCHAGRPGFCVLQRTELANLALQNQPLPASQLVGHRDLPDTCHSLQISYSTYHQRLMLPLLCNLPIKSRSQEIQFGCPWLIIWAQNAKRISILVHETNKTDPSTVESSRHSQWRA